MGEVALRSNDGEGKPGRTEPPCNDKQALCQSDAVAAPVNPRQRPCPLRRFAPAPPRGEPLTRRGSFTECESLSLWERWHCEAMTERASPAGQSRHAAISRPSVRAMLSPRLRVRASDLALSVTFGDSSPKGGAFDGEGYCRRRSQKIETRGIKR